MTPNPCRSSKAAGGVVRARSLLFFYQICVVEAQPLALCYAGRNMSTMNYVIRYDGGNIGTWRVMSDGWEELALTPRQALEMIATREINERNNDVATMSIRWLDVPDWEEIPSPDDFEAFHPARIPQQ